MPGRHPSVCNAPLVKEPAIIINGTNFEKRDIILNKKNGNIVKISETHIGYDALQYPLLFPRGENGYAINIHKVVPHSNQMNDKLVTAKEYYSYRSMVRNNNHLIRCNQLFMQYIVDMYAKIETERLNYIKFNQKKLRAEEYIHLKDHIESDSHCNANDIGKMVILPSSHIGSPRHMHEYTQDALTYVQNGGRPNLFITYTFNPKCEELESELYSGQRYADRHDLISRIFKLKLEKLIDVIKKGSVFGKVKYYLHSVEWQKRGLPHAHILVWLINDIKKNNIDKIISAEIPNENSDKKLYDIVMTNMIHGPCGQLNPSSPCMKNKKCIKDFPKKLIQSTQTDENSYPLYKRRTEQDGGYSTTLKIKSGQIVTVDNRWVVPYNPLLLKMFKSHINVEYCNSIKSIKYILKYINKGSDVGRFEIGNETQSVELDEIKLYQEGRYISSNEAFWRIFGFSIHERYPPIQRLDIHLENGERIYFNEKNFKEKVENKKKRPS